MKLLKVDGDRFVFQLSRQGKTVLAEALALYPLIPTAHHRVTQQAPPPELVETQQLIQEALAEHQQAAKQRLDAVWHDPNHLRETAHGFRLVLNAAEIDWFLQVLNDVRVGSWLKLGEPGYGELAKLDLTGQNARYFWAMELCGHFQALLLDALERRK